MSEKIEKLIKRCDTLRGQNSPQRDYHEDVATWCLPRKGWQSTIKNIGDRLKLNQLFDSTAGLALRVMSAGFHSNLTNPASKWFSLRTRNQQFMNVYDVKIWLKEVEDRMFSVLNNSNFDTTMQEFYTDCGCFGTGVVLTLEDVMDKVRFTSVPLHEIDMEEDAQGRVNRVYRTYRMTVQQMVEMFGKDAGQEINNKLADKPQDKIDVLHYVGPRDRYDYNKSDFVNMPYESLWINKKEKLLMRESGFMEFPYAVGRFYKDASDVWGISPAMDALSTIKLVNAQHKTMLRAGMKAADPALSVPRRGFIAPINANPSALNYRDKDIAGDAIQPLPTSGNIPITLEIIKMQQDVVDKAFFVPLFRSLSDVTKQMTVPEVQRRIAENMVLLGPVVGRFTDEVLDMILSRLFKMMLRNGELGDVPEVLSEQEMDIVYISPLAKAQRESEIYSVEAFLNDVGLIAQAKPEVLDTINGDATVDIIAEIRGINPKILADKQDVAKVRAQRAQMQEMQNRIALAQSGADAVKSGAEVEKLAAEAQAVGAQE